MQRHMNEIRMATQTPAFGQSRHNAHSTNKQNFPIKSKRNTTVMARNNPTTWGLKIPGRPPTPSEGHAQQFDRIGPPESQRLWTFDNGTCLRYGPDDLVDEFNDTKHPFLEQIALIDTVIRDIITVRSRYEVSAQKSSDGSQSDKTAIDEDPFNNFRQESADYTRLPKITLASGIYPQVQSRFATITTRGSVYLMPNKADVPGELHPGISNDTRFGMSGKPQLTAEQLREQQDIQRENNIHRHAMQRLTQRGSQNGAKGRRGRSSRQQSQQLGRNYDLYADARGYRTPTKGGPGRGEAYHRGGRGGGRRGKRNESPHRHRRFESQGYGTETPLPSFTFPVASSDSFTLDGYEDEGPLPETPRTQWSDSKFENDTGDNRVERGYRINNTHHTDIRWDGADPIPFRTVQSNASLRSLMNILPVTDAEIYPVADSFGIHPVPVDNQRVWNNHLQPSSMPTLQAEAFGDRAYGAENPLGRTAGARTPDMLSRLHDTLPVDGIPPYVGDKSTIQTHGSTITAPQVPIDAVAKMQAERRAALEKRFSGQDQSKPAIIDSIRSRRARPSLTTRESSTRPSTPFISEDGRSSEPPRNRPASLFPLVFRDGSGGSAEGVNTKM